MVWAEPAHPEPGSSEVTPDGIHVLDGSCYLNVGELHVNITNHGLIGSQYSSFLPYSAAPSGQWPGGSGDEYLWGAGLWVGGRIRGEVSVSTGQQEREFRPGPKLEDTIYEAKSGLQLRPNLDAQQTGRRLPNFRADDDGDQSKDEDPLNGYDDDGDGQVDEDWAQLGDQMFTCTMFDNLPLCRELYPAHRPLGLKVVQRAAAWADPKYEKIVALDYEVTNVGINTIEDAYFGFYVDCDIQARGDGSNQPDDLAGSFSGYGRGDDGHFYKVDVAWMKDAAVNDPLPGVFGVVTAWHTREFYGYHAPTTSAMTGFQIFATNASVNQQGEPTSDVDRYDLMSRHHFDTDRREDQSGDLKFMISSGPFPHLEPGRVTDYRLALVVGDGMGDMLEQAALAAQLGYGLFYNHDDDWNTGQGGRETLVCLGDIPSDGGWDPIYRHKILAADMTCIGPDPVFGMDLVLPENIREQEDGRFCVWVNGDNCDECFRVVGQRCTIENEYYWTLPRYRWDGTYRGSSSTGMGGAETRYSWSEYRPVPPPSPNMRVQPGDHRVEVFWDDTSEYVPDPANGQYDFEAYRVWRVQDWIRPAGLDEDSRPPVVQWGMLAEYDLVNQIPPGVDGINHARPLGRNTGLEPARYVPACMSDPEFAGLGDEMQAVVDSDSNGVWKKRPDVRKPNGAVRPGLEGLVPWEMRPDVLDTFWTVTGRAQSPGVRPKRAAGYYHFLDVDPPNGFPLYYTVVASDHTLVYQDGEYLLAGEGMSGNPGGNMVMTMPRPDPQTIEERRQDGHNIYVYPNPATREALAEFQQQAPTYSDATGVRVMFNNLPDTRNTIRIFTASGDHVITLDHNPEIMGGSISWNLMSRNGQEVTSGIYIYAVDSYDPAFDDFQGRFVVIR